MKLIAIPQVSCFKEELTVLGTKTTKLLGDSNPPGGNPEWKKEIKMCGSTLELIKPAMNIEEALFKVPPPFTIHRPPYHHPPSTIRHPPSTIHHPPWRFP